MFKTSESTIKLDKALIQAQAEFSIAKKDAKNPHFNSTYADLSSVLEACRPALLKYGIALTQWPISSDDGRAHLITRIAHEGEYQLSEMSFPVAKQDPHGFKSAITYLKRTMLESVLGIATQDDDGNTATFQASVAPPRVTHNYTPKKKEEPPWPNEPSFDANEPIPFDMPSGGEEDWIVPFGKFKGTKLGSIKKPELQSYIAYLIGEAAKENKPHSKNLKELMERAEQLWMNQLPF